MTSSASAVRAERERVLSFQGGCNFRDIGGYRTQQGTSTRWGKVYRTGVLTYFTEDDHAPLTQLQVRAICDLRRPEEREREPTRWPHGNVNALSWDDGVVTPTVRGLAADRPRNAAGMFDAMVALYRALPEWMGPRIGGMFSAIARWRCASGRSLRGWKGSHRCRGGRVAAVVGRAGRHGDSGLVADELRRATSKEFIRSRTEAQLWRYGHAHVRCFRCRKTCVAFCSAPTQRFCTKRLRRSATSRLIWRRRREFLRLCRRRFGRRYWSDANRDGSRWRMWSRSHP